MAKTTKAAPSPAEQDTDRLKGYLSALWTPLSTFFESRFIWLAVIPVGIWLWLDRALVKTWIGLLLAIVILVGLAYLVRKIVMPAEKYGRLEDYAQAALKGNVAAALVFLGGVGFMVAIVVVGVLWLGGMRG